MNRRTKIIGLVGGGAVGILLSAFVARWLWAEVGPWVAAVLAVIAALLGAVGGYWIAEASHSDDPSIRQTAITAPHVTPSQRARPARDWLGFWIYGGLLALLAALALLVTIVAPNLSPG